MMFITENRSAYSSSIASVIDGKIKLNWNGKDVGSLKEMQIDSIYRFTKRKLPLMSRVKAWFIKKQRENEILELEIYKREPSAIMDLKVKTIKKDEK